MEEENYRFMYITMPPKVTSKSLYSIQNRIKAMVREQVLMALNDLKLDEKILTIFNGTKPNTYRVSTSWHLML